MSLRSRTVVVRQLPETVDKKQARLFLRELESCINVDRPSIVLDCSRLLRMDLPAVQLLLNCLEEAMKRNGDIKLAVLSADTKSMLELNGVIRLFEVFDTKVDAVNSFLHLPLHPALQVYAPPGKLHRTGENEA